MLARDAGLEKCRSSSSNGSGSGRGRRLDLSLADCFVLAAAKRLGATLMTTDGEVAKVKDVNVKYFKL